MDVEQVVQEEELNLELSLIDHSGHTELSFTKAHMRARWTEGTMKERRQLRKVLAGGSKEGLTAYAVNADGKAGDKLDAKALKKLTGQKEGEVLLKGKTLKLKLVAKGLVEAEYKNGNTIMELQKNNSWKIIAESDSKVLTAGSKEKKKVTSMAGVGGG